MKHSLAGQILVAILFTVVIVIITMATLISYAMQDGFSKYLLRGELQRLDSLELALSNSYDPDQPGWPELQAAETEWQNLVLSHLELTEDLDREVKSGDADRSEIPQSSPRSQIVPHSPQGELVTADQTLRLPPPPDPLPMILFERLVLLDANGKRVVGSSRRSSLFETRTIRKRVQNQNAEIIGYLGLSEPEGARGPTDRFYLFGQYKSLALSALIALLVSVFIAFVLAKRLLLPIRRVADGAEILSAGDYSHHIVNDRSDELGELVNHYNALAESLDASRRTERQWISDTSHELQTPIAILRAEIEAFQDGIRSPDEKSYAEMHAAILRLSRLVNDIKILSITQEGQRSEMMYPDDLGDIIESVVDSQRLRAESKGLSLSFTAVDCLPILCDHQRLHQVVDNLIENALRYTNSPGEIKVSAYREEDRIIATVEDSAPCPEPNDLPHLFDRFYRTDRSRARQSGGSGLGLSICRAIIKVHGGTIEASPSPLGGLRITLTLPRNTTK
ncbi:ATP-binding protein [Cohaesibacter celericrescens]|nr:ATP-binding protein [Cohaesibacter celericrescens]